LQSTILGPSSSANSPKHVGRLKLKRSDEQRKRLELRRRRKQNARPRRKQSAKPKKTQGKRQKKKLARRQKRKPKEEPKKRPSGRQRKKQSANLRKNRKLRRSARKRPRDRRACACHESLPTRRKQSAGNINNICRAWRLSSVPQMALLQ
jgi:hypothetical protein